MTADPNTAAGIRLAERSCSIPSHKRNNQQPLSTCLQIGILSEEDTSKPCLFAHCLGWLSEDVVAKKEHISSPRK